MLAHGLRPHGLEGHMTLYKHVLHHSANTVPKWLLDHAERGAEMRRALVADAPEDVFSGGDLAALLYARALTVTPAEIDEDAIAALRDAGFDDGEILEINQVTAYFAYANRTVLGLGVTTAGDTLGLSPNQSENPDDWSHT